MSTDILRLQWADVEGQSVTTMLRAVPNEFPEVQLAMLAEGAVFAAACSVAKRTTALWETAVADAQAGSGTAGDFGVRTYLMRLDFQTTTGSTHPILTPCPKSACFLESGEVDESQADVAAWIAWLLDSVCDTNGDGLAEFIGGSLVTVSP